MKPVVIRSVETFPLRLAADGQRAEKSSYVVAANRPTIYAAGRETLFVRIESEQGDVGWGEALAPVAPRVPAAIVEDLLTPALIGADAADVKPLRHKLGELMRERGHLVGHQADALAAVDIALWDLAARRAGVAVTTLLGGAFRDTVPTYVSGLPEPTDEARAALAADWVRRGATAVKLHLGHGVAADLATVRAIRAAAPELRVAVDAHWAYSVTDALRLAAGLTELDAWFLEAPLAPEDITGHAELVARSTIAVAIGEALRNRYEFSQWLDARALRIAQPDVARTGITELLAIAELCAARHVPVAPHHSVGLGVSLAAGVAVSTVLEQLPAFEYQPTSAEVGDRVLTEPFPRDAGSMPVPAGPGLGIEIDEDAVRRLVKES